MQPLTQPAKRNEPSFRVGLACVLPDARRAEIKAGHLLEAQPFIPDVICILGGIEFDVHV